MQIVPVLTAGHEVALFVYGQEIGVVRFTDSEHFTVEYSNPTAEVDHALMRDGDHGKLLKQTDELLVISFWDEEDSEYKVVPANIDVGYRVLN